MALSERRWRDLATGLAVLSAGVLFAGCSPADPAPPVSNPAPAPVVMPGAPGDEPRIVTGDEAGRGRQARHSLAAEAAYVRMMIPHHQQAIEMTALAPERAIHPQVRALAERIGGAQGPEIGAMQGWSASHGQDEHHADAHGESGSGEHGHGSGHPGNGSTMMPGMATAGQLAGLKSARGADFDRMFLRLMTAHHEGAVVMATDVLTKGLDEQVHEMAQDVLATQSDEISTMRRLLGEV